MQKLTREQATALNAILHYLNVQERLEAASRVFAPWHFQPCTDVQDRRLAAGPADGRGPGRRSDDE